MQTKRKVDAPAEVDTSLNRRDSLKLMAGIVALATGLGVPRPALGMAPNAARLMFKFYRGEQDGGGLLDSFQLSDSLTQYLTSAAGSRLQMKFHEKTAGELGSMPIPRQIFIKIERLPKA